MFSISENTVITGLENVRSIGHLKHIIWETYHDTKYSFLGKTVRRGTTIVNSVDGSLKIAFDVKNGWARSISIEKYNG